MRQGFSFVKHWSDNRLDWQSRRGILQVCLLGGHSILLLRIHFRFPSLRFSSYYTSAVIGTRLSDGIANFAVFGYHRYILFTVISCFSQYYCVASGNIVVLWKVMGYHEEDSPRR